MCKGLEGYAENKRAEGRAEGVVSTLVSLVKDGLLTVAEAAKRAGLTEAELKKFM